MSKAAKELTVITVPVRQRDFSPRKTIMLGVAILSLFFGGLLIWAVWAPLHAAVHAQGELTFQNKRQAVQHLEGGIVKKILVKDGDTVKAGQPLVILEDDQVRPIVDMMRGQDTAEVATMIRLEAEKNDLATVTFPASIPASIRNTEERLFKAKRESFLKQVEVLKTQLEQTREIIKGAQEQLVSKGREIASIKEQLDAHRTLFKDGYVTKSMILDLERAFAEKQGEKEQIRASIASNQQRLAEIDQRMLVVRTDRIQQAANELKSSMMKRLELQERVRPSLNTLERQIIRAPVAGKVVGLKIATIGGLVLPREPIMEIAPSGDHLIVTAKVAVSDINDLRSGQDADVQITAFKSSSMPALKAKLTYISDDRLTTQTPQGTLPFYSVDLELDETSLKELTAEQRLVPGMQAQVTIATKPRTALDYFLGPLRDRMGKAFHAK